MIWGLGFVSNDLGFNWMHFSSHDGYWNWHVIYWWVSPRLENVYLTRPNRDVTFAPCWFTMYGFAPIWFIVYSPPSIYQSYKCQFLNLQWLFLQLCPLYNKYLGFMKIICLACLNIWVSKFFLTSPSRFCIFEVHISFVSIGLVNSFWKYATLIVLFSFC